MRRIITILSFLTALTSVAHAQLQAGYYRVNNYGTERYIHIVDNTSSTTISRDIDDIMEILTQGVDLGAIELKEKSDDIISDPSAVMYVSQKNGSSGNQGYNIASQDISTYQILNRYFSMRQEDNQQYVPYLQISSIEITLYDRIATKKTTGEISVIPPSTIADLIALRQKGKTIEDCRCWSFTPIDSKTDSYFGIQPTIHANNKYYSTFYAGFAFQTASPGMKVYIISDICKGAVQLTEINGIIPAATPVIIECSSKNPSDNRIDIIKSDMPTTPENIMKGVYYMNTTKNHNNCVSYDKNTMRILGTTSNGTLGFVKASDLANIPANSAYILVSEDNRSEQYSALTPTAYEFYKRIITETPEIENTINTPFTVYSIDGTLVTDRCWSINDLESGTYIINGQKIHVR